MNIFLYIYIYIVDINICVQIYSKAWVISQWRRCIKILPYLKMLLWCRGNICLFLLTEKGIKQSGIFPLLFPYSHVFFFSSHSHHSTPEHFQLGHIFLGLLLILPGWELGLRDGVDGNPMLEKSLIPNSTRIGEGGEKRRKTKVGESD